jgi:hypothetical protein
MLKLQLKLHATDDWVTLDHSAIAKCPPHTDVLDWLNKQFPASDWRIIYDNEAF